MKNKKNIITAQEQEKLSEQEFKKFIEENLIIFEKTYTKQDAKKFAKYTIKLLDKGKVVNYSTLETWIKQNNMPLKDDHEIYAFMEDVKKYLPDNINVEGV